LRKSVDRVDLSDRLFVNSAVAGHVPYQDIQEEFKPYTVCETTDHGWVWQIAIKSRIGTGMLFDRNITDEEEAKKYFCKYWDHRIAPENLKILKWDPFYLRDPWKGNVVCLGLSSGFIEPLESTGVGTAIVAATRLSNILKERAFQQYDIDFYNSQLVTLFEDAADFVAAHYAENKKQSEFWDHVRNKFVPSEKMKLILDDFNNVDKPVHYDGNLFRFFNGVGWTLLMIQLGFKVLPKSLPVSSEQGRYELIKDYVEITKYRWNHSSNHLEEIKMYNDIANLNK
jgi:Tryptophan halogenase.